MKAEAAKLQRRRNSPEAVTNEEGGMEAKNEMSRTRFWETGSASTRDAVVLASPACGLRSWNAIWHRSFVTASRLLTNEGER